MTHTLKTTMIAALTAGAMTTATTQAQASGDFTAGIGFMERSDTAYGFLKGDGAIFEDSKFKHKLGFEFIGYRETLDPALDTDLIYSTFVGNYEVEYKASQFVSLFVGGGVGFQHIDLDSPVGSLDDDFNGYAQVFGGVKAQLWNDLDLHLGVRRMFFDDAELLGVSGIKQEQTWGIEVGLTLAF